VGAGNESKAMAAAALAPSASETEAPRITKLDMLVEPTLRQVLELEREVFPQCEQLGPVLMQQQAAMRTCGMLVAEVGLGIAGFCLFSRTASSGLIAKLAVSSAFRRRGIGSSLLSHGITELEQPTRRGAGASEIMLHVDPSRSGACRMYESFGFVAIQHLPQYYTDGRDALLMRRVRPVS